MVFDWVTWSIWLVGFLVLIVWIILPLKELRRLLADRRRQAEKDPLL